MIDLMDGMLKIKQQRRGEAGHLIPETMTGFPGIYVWVSQFDAAIEEDGLDRERLWFEVQKRLTWAGLPVPNQENWQQTPPFPCLGVIVHADRAQVTPPFYVFSVELFFVQKINSADTPASSSMRLVWCREAIGDARHKSAEFDWSNLYSTVSSLVDQFLQEYLGLAIPEVSAMVCN
jgi:hypothetical protein